MEKNIVKQKMINCLKKVAYGKLEPVASLVYKILIKIEWYFFSMKWFIHGYRKPEKEEIDFVCKNVTFIYKSFERQKMAKKLYKNIQSYYPGVRVIIAEDSEVPLEIKKAGACLKIIRLPFNSGLSRGLNAALNEVETPFIMRMDDDELLTPLTGVGKELKFLVNHPEIDLVGFMPLSVPKCEKGQKEAQTYYKQLLFYAPKQLKIPHLTLIDKEHIVVAKPANIWLARTEKVRSIGWDDNIRMIDHNEFFVRASGNLVSVLNPNTAVFHYHNPFDRHYQKFRGDVQGDREYIAQKRY